MTVLVAAASRHGATAEIAAAIGRVLGARGFDTEVARAEDVADLSGYDAVVLGSAVYMGSWLEPARRLVEGQSTALAGRPTWLFSSGPIGEPPRPAEDKAVQIDDVVARTQAREHRLFAGRLTKHGLSFGERAVALAFRAAEGDFRDWSEIESWASGIAEALESPP